MTNCEYCGHLLDEDPSIHNLIDWNDLQSIRHLTVGFWWQHGRTNTEFPLPKLLRVVRVTKHAAPRGFDLAAEIPGPGSVLLVAAIERGQPIMGTWVGP